MVEDGSVVVYVILGVTIIICLSVCLEALRRQWKERKRK